MLDDFLFVNKYAPSTVEECILPKSIKDFLIQARDKKELPNLILSGNQGMGKTSCILALAKELKMDFMMINGSEEGRFIDTIRNKVQSYASTVSLTNTGKKILLIDEADNVTHDAQLALRGAIEKLQKNCIFIFTCNYKNKILPPLHSRCSVLEFIIPPKEKPKLALEFFQRLEDILSKEGIEYEKKVLVELVQKYFPDFRRTLNELQRYTSTGKLDIGSIGSSSQKNIEELMGLMKERNFREVKKWTTQNIDNDVSKLYRQVYDGLNIAVVPSTLPSAIIHIADYQYKNSFVSDSEINLLACLVEIMSDCEFV
jgi:DNA polymerase III delta prime subunit